MKNRNSKSLIFILILIIIFACGVCQKKSKKIGEANVLKIPDTRFMGILPLYIAEEKGFFGEEGISIKWIDVRDPGQAARLFFAGKADFMMSTFANLIPAEVRKRGTIKLLFPIYESSQDPGSYILVHPNSEIENISDLHGKKLGTYSGPSQKAYAIIVLRNLGFREPDDIRLVQVSSSAQVQGLFGGSFDALFTVETYGSTAISKGARILEKGVRTKYISNPFWLGAGAVSKSLSENRPQNVKALLKALEKAAKYINENEQDARAVLARRTNTEINVAQICALYTWVAYPTKSDLKQIQDHIDLLAAEGLINESINVTDLFEGILND